MPMISPAPLVHAAAAAVCPIVGVVIGNAEDRATWRVVPAEGATDEQIAAAAVAVAGVVWPPLAVVPAAVSPYQARQALTNAGLRDLVEAAVAAAPEAVRDAWEYGLEVRRDSPMIAALAQALGLTAAQLDQLFVQAGAI